MNIKGKSYRGASGARSRVLGPFRCAGEREVAAIVGPPRDAARRPVAHHCRLDQDFEGEVELPAHGRLGVVFQEPRLLPWRTVEENVRLAAPQASEAALKTLFATLELAEHRRHYPSELSLGLARRVALARAFAVEPELLVLDEPFVSLDDALAAKLRAELVELVSRRPVTTLIVTHNIEEAIGLADRIFLLSGSPAQVLRDVPFERPRVARQAEEIAAIRSMIERRVDQS